MAVVIGDTEFCRLLLASDPRNPRLRGELAQGLLVAGEFEAVIVEASAALEHDPGLAHARLARAAARKAIDDLDGAASDFEAVLALHPDRIAILVNLAYCYAGAARLADAEGVLRRAVAIAPDNAEAHANLGSILVRQERFEEAEAPCRTALALCPDLIAAHQNLAAILASTDPEAARRHRDAAYCRRQVFIEHGVHPECTVLVLTAADAANTPLQHLLPRARYTLVRWYVEYATANQDRALPPFDLVVNAIGEADLLPDIAPPVARLLRENDACVLNPPAVVAATGRSALPIRLTNISGIVVPPVLRHAGGGSPFHAVQAARLGLPVLFRPIGAHGGEGVRRIDDERALRLLAADSGYLTRFVDFASPDGWFRKYRAIFVDGRVFPYHLAISKHWLVHYWTAGMESDAVRREEERRFLDDPGAVIGRANLAALEVIARRLGLDYGGIDFAILPDGRLLVFEANATMLVHPERDPRLAYRNPAVAAIQSAFETMMHDRKKRAVVPYRDGIGHCRCGSA